MILDAAINDWTLIVPPTFTAEADSAVCRGVHLRLISAEEGELLFERLDTLPVSITMNLAVRQRARSIAKELAQPRVYDATYAALAEVRGCDFWTADKRFYNAARQKYSFVRYLGDYLLTA